MAQINSYRDLQVWQKSMRLAERCYELTRRFSRIDQDVLGLQIRKSCVSVPSNIAEGHGRHYTPAYINHLWIGNGSNNELATQLELAFRLRLIKEQDATTLIADAEEIGRMLRGLVASLERALPHS